MGECLVDGERKEVRLLRKIRRTEVEASRSHRHVVAPGGVTRSVSVMRTAS